MDDGLATASRLLHPDSPVLTSVVGMTSLLHRSPKCLTGKENSDILDFGGAIGVVMLLLNTATDCLKN